ncbi:sorbitol dehydrogenase-like [Ruditapes philippinarum]|uniref:sorbitol dehydrogenase-like n=1 Tax=Ruditapes philippinarum TaxID=129788 RepID=UPI00295AD7CA|nr:sorbitol dehydrogenase-like [Ruditapes philippinarum]
MSEENLAAVLHGPLDVRFEKISVPEPGHNEVLLSMGSVGICGSDIKYWQTGKCGRFTVEAPMVMGHEAAGTVVKVGPGVQSLKVGDRVAIEPGVPCRICHLCKTGRYNLCKDVFFCATPPDHGNMCKFYKHPADFCFKLPDHVSLDEGAMLEPLAVALYSCKRGNVGPGSRVLICGAGPVGILAMMVAKQMGAASVLLTDISDNRLSVAKSLGANHVIKVNTDDPKELANQIEATMGCQPDVSIECSAVDFSFRTAIYATYPGGSIVMVGRGSFDVTIPYTIAATKEVDIKGLFRYANCYPAALDFVATGAIDVKSLVTHHFPLLETVEAFKTAKSPSSNAMKVIIHCDQ